MPARVRTGVAGGAGARRPCARRTSPRKAASGERLRSRPRPRRIDQRKFRDARPRARPRLLIPGDFIPLVVH